MTNNLVMFLKIFALYIGAVIGAGFASGQEIMQFFIGYGIKGIGGVVVAGLLFGYLGMVIMYLATKLQATNYQHVLPLLMGKGAVIFDVLSLLMLIGGLGVMFAGSGAVLNQFIGVPNYIGVTAALIITCVVIYGGVNRVLSANLLLVPIKLSVVIFISALALIKSGVKPDPAVINFNHSAVAANWLWASILYVSYNMVVPLAVLSTTGRIVSVKVGVLAGLWGGLVLGLAIGLVTAAGLSFYPEIFHYSVPMLYLVSCVAPYFETFFALLIWLAMLTTAIADAHGFASRVAPQGGKYYKICGIGICFAVLPLTQFGFAPLVQKLYPLFGYLGLILTVTLLITPFIKAKKLIP